MTGSQKLQQLFYVAEKARKILIEEEKKNIANATPKKTLEEVIKEELQADNSQVFSQKLKRKQQEINEVPKKRFRVRSF